MQIIIFEYIFVDFILAPKRIHQNDDVAKENVNKCRSEHVVIDKSFLVNIITIGMGRRLDISPL